jgi:hypothetical protein
MDTKVKICTNVIKFMLIDPETNTFLCEFFQNKNDKDTDINNIIEGVSSF